VLSTQAEAGNTTQELKVRLAEGQLPHYCLASHMPLGKGEIQALGEDWQLPASRQRHEHQRGTSTKVVNFSSITHT